MPKSMLIALLALSCLTACNRERPEDGICLDRCGDGQCQEMVCLGSGCPCAESADSCPQDCRTATP
jgi:hypothetical protein